VTALNLDHLRQWVGREQTVEDFLGLFPARALAAALDHAGSLAAGDPLPPAWHWLYFLETARRSATGNDGHPKKGDFLPPIELPRRMWAAGSMEIAEPLRLGEHASRRSTVRSIDHKNGKSGELVFVNLDHELRQHGKLCIREEQTLVYRTMPTEHAPLPPGERSSAAVEWSGAFEPDPVALFRFSALTFNAHRIHYDRDYATGQEFYAGLVVHAPLLVTLLLDLLAREAPSEPLRALRFRAVRPTFDLSPVRLCGRREGSQVNLWTADTDGYTGMSAVAVLGGVSG
jgi:3-methylfumaryl-CoA hydratase